MARCPDCKGTLVRIYTSGEVEACVLVDTSDPDAGVLAVVVDGDVQGPRSIRMMVCATCDHWPGEYPRTHGFPLFRAATAIWEKGKWPSAALWECTDHNTEYFATRLERLLCKLEIERGQREEIDCHCRPSRYAILNKSRELPGRGPEPIPTGQHLDHPQGAAPAPPQPVNELTAVTGVDDLDAALGAVRAAQEALDAAHEQLRVHLRRESSAGTTANELARRAEGTLSRPLVLRAVRGPAVLPAG